MPGISQTAMRRASSRTLYPALMCVHVVLTAVGLVGLFTSPHAHDGKMLVATSVLTFCCCVSVLIVKIRDVRDLFLPSGVVAITCYIGYYVKGLIYIVLSQHGSLNEEAGYAQWSISAKDVSYAFELSTIAFLAFALGLAAYWSYGRRHEQLGVQRQDARYVRHLDPVYLDRIAKLFLVLGAAAVIARTAAVWGLGIGGSIGEPERVAGIPLLAGFINLETLWGGRFILAAAFVYNVATGRSGRVVSVLIGCLAFGLLPSVFTASKSEILIPFIIIAVASALLHGSMSLGSRRIVIGWLMVFGLSYALVYPSLHDYRYRRKDMGLGSYMKNNSEKFSIMQGAYEICFRLTGVEGLVSIVAYERECGHRPVISSNLKDTYVQEIQNYPVTEEIGLSFGIWGGLYLAGGVPLLLSGAFLIGLASSFFTVALLRRMSGNSALALLTIAFVGVLSQLVVRYMMFSGEILFDLKHLFCLLLPYAIARYGLTKHGASILDNIDRGVRRRSLIPIGAHQ